MNYSEVLKPYIDLLYDEMNDNFPKGYIVDTYSNLLKMNKFVKNDLGDLEKIMISYLTKEVQLT